MGQRVSFKLKQRALKLPVKIMEYGYECYSATIRNVPMLDDLHVKDRHVNDQIAKDLLTF